MRAKVLSSEGRDLANVEIPTYNGDTLTKWWGFSIAPDGTVHELPQAELRSQSVMKEGRSEYAELRGVIPGVEPGSIIDYGYVKVGSGHYTNVEISLQGEHAIRQLRYRWIPYERAQGEWTIEGTDSKKAAIRRDGKSIVIESKDLRPLRDEPYMPPRTEVRTTVTMFYGNGFEPQPYWIWFGGAVDELVQAYGPKDKSLQLALQQMAFPSGADTRAKARFVYDWIGKNIRNTGSMSAEEFEFVGAVGSDKKLTARRILSDRYGAQDEINLLYASFVRALGAEAHLVFAVDRTRRYWNPYLKSPSQFAYALVAVKMKGEPDDKEVVVDAASGLPFGELPWQASGTHAVVAVANGFRPTPLMPTMADRNVGETDVALSFESDGDAMVSKWSFVGRGQQGRESRASLRSVAGEERLKKLDTMCGAGRWDPRRAEAPELDDRTAPFKLDCEIETDTTNFDASLGRYSVSVTGPWWPAVADFTEPTRSQPIVFPFPKTDIVRVEVAPPPGFRVENPPEPVRIDSQIGTYVLEVVAADTGYRVSRKLELKALKVIPEGYGLVRKFLSDVARADRTPLTFRSESSAP
jgi:hypothetical protein